MSASASALVEKVDHIDRMVDGSWLEPYGAVPTHRPIARSVSAVLPRLDADRRSADGFVALDLVLAEVIQPRGEFRWLVLSDAGIYTYGHTIGLNLGERWRFIAWDDGRPSVYSVQYGEPLDHALIADLYGAEIRDRARDDRPAVQLRLTPAWYPFTGRSPDLPPRNGSARIDCQIRS